MQYSSEKAPGNLLSKAGHLLQLSRGKKCCWSLLRNYRCNRFASSSITIIAFLVDWFCQDYQFFLTKCHGKTISIRFNQLISVWIAEIGAEFVFKLQHCQFGVQDDKKNRSFLPDKSGLETHSETWKTCC